MQDVAQSGKAIVLLRFLGEADGQRVGLFEGQIGDDNLGIALGDFETGGETTRRMALPALSEQTKRDGWGYLILPPGIHYLAVQPQRRTNVFTYEAGFRRAPRWRIDVPDGASAVYSGTLLLRGSGGTLLFTGKYLRTIDPEQSAILDEEDAAQKLFAEFFPQLGPPRTVLMTRQTGPAIIRTPVAR